MRNLDFEVTVNGKKIELYPVMQTFAEGRMDYDGGHYEIGSFDSDAEVEVEIHSSRDLSRTTILPENAEIEAERTVGSIRFRLKKHGTYVFEPQTYKDTPLILFFNEAEKNIPDRNDPKVKWFGPGEYSAGKIELHDGETLYLAPGAIVEGSLFAKGDDITVCGRGILTQRALERKAIRFCLDFYHCRHLTLTGFVCADPCLWNVVLRDCRDVTIDNVKICGGRMINDDGIDVCNSSNVTIRNSFVRAQDDIITPKGFYDEEGLKVWDKEYIATHFEPDRRPVSNVLAENCVFWCDAANVFRIGYECIAAAMENITVRNCDIVHVSDVYRPQEHYWTNTVWYIQPDHRMPIRHLLFENLRIYVDVPDLVLMRLTPMECPPWIGFGTISNCTFRNITVSGPSSTFKGPILIAGHDENSTVTGITFDHFIVFGKKVTADYPYLTLGDFADVPEFPDCR